MHQSVFVIYIEELRNYITKEGNKQDWGERSAKERMWRTSELNVRRIIFLTNQRWTHLYLIDCCKPAWLIQLLQYCLASNKCQSLPSLAFSSPLLFPPAGYHFLSFISTISTEPHSHPKNLPLKVHLGSPEVHHLGFIIKLNPFFGGAGKKGALLNEAKHFWRSANTFFIYSLSEINLI